MSPTASASPASLSLRETFRVLLEHVRQVRGRLILGALLGLAGAAAMLGQPLAAKALIDRLQHQDGLTGALALLTVLVLLGAALKAWGQYLLAHTAESVVRGARRRLVARLLRLKVSELDRSEPGDLMARVTSDTTLLRQITTQSVVSATISVLGLAGVLVMMGMLDVVLLGVSVCVAAMVSGVVVTALPRISAATARAQSSVGDMGAVLERALGALRTVKASGAEERETAVVHRAVDEAWRGGVAAAKWQSLMGTSAGLTVQLSFLTVLAVGGARVASGAIDVATLVAFLLFLFYLMDPISQLIQAVGQFHVSAAAVARLREAERLEVDPLDAPAPAPALAPASAPARRSRPSRPPGESAPPVSVLRKPGTPATVVFENVVFRYRPGLPDVHRGVDFAAVPGGMTALVGPSGAGKTTLFTLLERFYEPTSGRVLLDGADVRDRPLADLRAALGYIEQDAPVLSGTLRDNLLFAAPDADERRLEDVLVRTRLTGLVRGLPQGLDTPVGHRGVRLSGGERQRVAIARALLRAPRVLLLDEATSQLDAANEHALREVIADVARETTVLVVAHRLSTVTMADRIVVLESGRVRAIGTHGELVTTDRLYGELAATQLLTSRPA
ncbi:ABC transporter ATP-binding protein [Streptomyces sp. NPDC054796]